MSFLARQVLSFNLSSSLYKPSCNLTINYNFKRTYSENNEKKPIYWEQPLPNNYTNWLTFKPPTGPLIPKYTAPKSPQYLSEVWKEAEPRINTDDLNPAENAYIFDELWNYLQPNKDIFAGVDKTQLNKTLVEDLTKASSVTKEMILAQDEHKGKKLDLTYVQSVITNASLTESKKDFEEFKTNKAKFAQTVIDNIFAKYYASTLKSIGITSMITTEKQFHPDLFSNYLKLAVDKFKSPKLALTILQAYEIYTAALRKFKVDSSEKKKEIMAFSR